jgi:hypothetical protein
MSQPRTERNLNWNSSVSRSVFVGLIRFRLRTLLVVMTIAAVWLGLMMKRLRDQESGVAIVRARGGGIAYDYQFDSAGNWRPGLPEPGPPWLREVFGPEWGKMAVCVSLPKGGHGNIAFIFGDGRTKDRDLDQLVTLLPNLRSLELDYNIDITDDGLAHIARLTHLLDLDLRGCAAITDDGINHLRRLSRLRRLRVVDTRITEQGKRAIEEALPGCRIVESGFFGDEQLCH